MINIDELTSEDIGRPVIYHQASSPIEVGVLSSWNTEYVFVRFGTTHCGAACRPQDVRFENEVQQRKG